MVRQLRTANHDLGGHTPNIHAGAADDIVTLDQCYGCAALNGLSGGGERAGTAADDHNVGSVTIGVTGRIAITTQ